jgi:hypothetical protein
VTIVEAIAKSHRQHVPWNDLEEMRQVSSKAAYEAIQLLHDDQQQYANEVSSHAQERQPPQQQMYDSFTVFVAWMVLLFSAVYLIVKYVIRVHFRRRFHHFSYHFRHHNAAMNGMEMLSDGIFGRLQDLDDAWHLSQACFLFYYHHHRDKTISSLLTHIWIAHDAIPPEEQPSRITPPVM